jgi:hypothetical protein
MATLHVMRRVRPASSTPRVGVIARGAGRGELVRLVRYGTELLGACRLTAAEPTAQLLATSLGRPIDVVPRDEDADRFANAARAGTLDALLVFAARGDRVDLTLLDLQMTCDLRRVPVATTRVEAALLLRRLAPRALRELMRRSTHPSMLAPGNFPWDPADPDPRRGAR